MISSKELYPCVAKGFTDIQLTWPKYNQNQDNSWIRQNYPT